MTHCDCVIPCAGLSERMGEWKPMVQYRKRPLILSTVATALKVSPRIILVTGHRAGDLEALFAGEKRVITTHNDDYTRGMFSSIQEGVKLVESDWFFVTLGDMPEIPTKLFELLPEKAAMNQDYDILRPVCEERPGHPVFMRSSVIQTIGELPPDSTMQKMFSRHHKKTGKKVLNLRVDFPGCIFDVDTVEDLHTNPAEKYKEKGVSP